MLANTQYVERAFPLNVVLLAIVSGVIGLVLTGFTAWHISLAVRGLTTIECLEKTRYLSPLRRTFDIQRQQFASYDAQSDAGFGSTLHNYGQQLLDMHANAIPGVTRAEEGEERPSPTVASRRLNPPEPTNGYNPVEHTNHYQSPAQQSLYRSFEELERNRERNRYEDYLDEQDSEKLPNAFDLGWKRNLIQLFGSNPLLWGLPICTTVGDGWHWEPSSRWREARQSIERERLKRWEESQRQDELQVQQSGQWRPQRSWQVQYPEDDDSNTGHFYNGPGETHRSPAGVSMKTLPPRSPRSRAAGGDFDTDAASDKYSTSSDEQGTFQSSKARGSPQPRGTAGHDRRLQDTWSDWD